MDAIDRSAASFARAAERAVQRAMLRLGQVEVRWDGDRIVSMIRARGEASGRAVEAAVREALRVMADHLPHAEKLLWEAIDVVFSPKTIIRQIVAAAVLQTCLITWQQIYVLARRFMNRFSRNGRQIMLTRRAMRAATTYDEWVSQAERLDGLEGHEAWRKDPNSKLYDKRLLQRRIEELEALMADGNVFDLMFRMRGGLARNQYGLLHEGLFSRAHAGTKQLVEGYVSTICKALHFIAAEDTADLDIPLEAKLAFFNETRHAYGRSALLLSGGAAMGFYHVGVVKALLSQGLLPRVISGASAGSIVTAMVGVRTNEELLPLFRGENVSMNFFLPHRLSPRNPRGASAIAPRELRGGAGRPASMTLLLPPALRWLGDVILTLLWHNESLLKMDTEHFRSVLRANIGLYTFQEAFDRTGRIINITVSPKSRTDPPRLLNYLTAPHVLVFSAAVASSSVPGVFEPSPLYVKESDGVIRPESSDDAKFADGSMEADLPMAQLAELFNVNHFVVSQVNPHATVLSTLGLNDSIWRHPALGALSGVVRFLKDQLRTWYQHVAELVGRQTSSTQWVLRQGLTQLVTQEYEGRDNDITIWPWKGHEGLVSSFVRMLENPTPASFRSMVNGAEANTWPIIAKVRSHCATEQQFEKSIQMIRRKITARKLERSGAPGEKAPDGDDGATSLSARGRVPSFYTSPSLIKLSGLAIADTTDLPSLRQLRVDGVTSDAASSASAEAIDALLASPPSAKSLDGSDSPGSSRSEGFSMPRHAVKAQSEVLKTSSMANFYYRRSRSADNLRGEGRARRKSFA